jgi:uncharacterized protein YbbC (DUF1343 family)
MIRRLITGILSIVVFAIAPAGTPKVQTGIEVLRDRSFDLLQGKRVGLITNPTGVDRQLRATIDILFAAKGVSLVALYGPEHGVRGDYAAGDIVDFYTDPQTKLPVYSLYGKTRKPTPDMLNGVDILVYDIQDIGCRSYTYISTMGLAMEAAATQGIPFVVLDRPNPLGGNRVEGNSVEKGFFSFVSQFPIPYVYGLTCGELARMLNDEGMLNGGARCSLTVVPMKGWKRSMTFAETGLPWVPTSPHVPHDRSPLYYVSTGILGELGVISEGVGYTLPFQLLAAEWINGSALAAKMNALNMPGLLFRPITVKPFYGRSTGKTLQGVQVHIITPDKVNLMSVQFRFLEVHNQLYPEKNPFTLAEGSRIGMFDKVAGTDKVRTTFAARMRYDDVKDLLEGGTAEFQARSKKYLLY